MDICWNVLELYIIVKLYKTNKIWIKKCKTSTNGHMPNEHKKKKNNSKAQGNRFWVSVKVPKIVSGLAFALSPLGPVWIFFCFGQ